MKLDIDKWILQTELDSGLEIGTIKQKARERKPKKKQKVRGFDDGTKKTSRRCL